jgi:hypothetical protein
MRLPESRLFYPESRQTVGDGSFVVLRDVYQVRPTIVVDDSPPVVQRQLCPRMDQTSEVQYST